MSSSPTATLGARAGRVSKDELLTVGSERVVQYLLEALENPDCRRILEAASGGALSAKEVSAACDLPLSTAYRKLEMLTKAGLVEERTRIHPDGKHANEYARCIDDVVVSVDEGRGLQVSVSFRGATNGGPLLGLHGWG